MSCIDTIKHIYSSPEWIGEAFLLPLKGSHGVFIECIENSPGCQKLAWVIASLFTATFYPAFLAVAAVGMVLKTISFIVNNAKDTLVIWKKLAAAIDQPYEDSQFGIIGAIIKAKAFSAWVAENSEALNTIVRLHPMHCRLSTLPEEIGQLRNLEELNLSGNKLMTLPEAICQLPNLRILNLCANQLTSLPDSISQLAKLEELNLSLNNLTAFPEVTCQLTNLQNLALGDNQLTSLPDSIGQLTNLQSLSLIQNKFTIIPEVINQLSSLHSFDISENQLTSIPNWIGQLQNLMMLRLSHNSQTTLPESLAHRSPFRFPSENQTTLVFNSFGQLHAELINSINRLSSLRNELSSLTNESSSLPQITSLEDALAFWLREYQKKFPKLCTDNKRYPSEDAAQKGWVQFYGPLLMNPKKDQLLRFLNGLKEIEDLKKEPSKSHVIQRAGQMLEWAAVNDKFRKGLFANLEEALGACRDRVTLVFNGLEVLWHSSQAEKLTDKEMIQLLVGIHRLDMLRQLATKRIEELKREDAIEVHLFYQVKLKDELKLPVSTQYMAYEATAGISDEMLAEDKSTVLEATSSPEQVAAILVEENKWIERIRAKEKKQFDQINEALNEELNQIPSEDKEQLQLEQHKKLLTKEKQQTKHLIKTLTLDFLLAS